jgi:polygalacturonase
MPIQASLLLALFGCSNLEKPPFSREYAQQKIKIAWDSLPARLARIQPPFFPERDFSVLDFGARDDSLFDSRPGLQEAIQACGEAGGGRVIVPAGYFFSKGPLHLVSNVNLHLEEGATLLFSDDPEDYLPPVKVRWEGTVAWNYSPLIYANGQKNLAITGKGVVDGNGREWSMEWRKVQKPDKDRLRQMGNDLVPEDQRVFGKGFLDLDGDGEDDGFGDGKPHFLRPSLVEFYACRNILLDGPTFLNSPFWTLHFPFTNNVTCRNLSIRGGYYNDDGIDPDSSEDVLIEDCDIRTHDDAISIKAGRDQDAWERPGSRNIIIRNCRLESQTNAFCIGSEMSGGVREVFIENCELYPQQHAITFKCNLDRGGQVEEVYIRGMDIKRLEEAMFIFRMDYHGYRGNHFPTRFNDFYVSDMTCSSIEQFGFKIVGVPDQKIRRVYLENIRVDSAGTPYRIEYAADILMHRVRVNGQMLEGKIPAATD